MSASKKGLAGEYLVCSLICKYGHFAYLSAASCSYDVVAEVGDKLIRIQVKSTGNKKLIYSRKNIYGYRFIFARHIPAAEADLVAFVALDTGDVAFMPSPINHTELSFYPAGSSKHGRKNIKNMDDYSFQAALKELK